MTILAIDTLLSLAVCGLVLGVKTFGAIHEGGRVWGAHERGFLDVDPFLLLGAELLALSVVALWMSRASHTHTHTYNRHTLSLSLSLSLSGARSDHRFETRRYVRWAFVVCIAVVVCWIFRDVTHLLGDGGRIIHDAHRAGIVRGTEILPGVLNVHLTKLLVGVGMHPIRALELFSCVLGGVYLLVLLQGSTVIGLSGSRRWLLIVLLATLGTSQFFFGYLESYPTLIVFVLGYLFASLRSLQRTGGVRLPTLLLGLSIASHLSALVLVPAHVFLLSRLGAHVRPRWMVAQAVMVVAPILGAFVLAATTADVTLDTDLPRSVFLRLTGDYSLFSRDHWLDLLNEIWLVCPVAAPLVILALANREQRRSIRTDEVTRFLAVASLGFGLFAFASTRFSAWPGTGISLPWRRCLRCSL